MMQFDDHIFQMGWNHPLVTYFEVKPPKEDIKDYADVAKLFWVPDLHVSGVKHVEILWDLTLVKF